MEKKVFKKTMKDLGITQAEMVRMIRALVGDKFLTNQSTFSLWLKGDRRKAGFPWPVVKAALTIFREYGMDPEREPRILSELGFPGVRVELAENSMVKS